MIFEKSMAAQPMIKNRSELAITPLRIQALDIIEAGISRVLPSTVMKNAVKFNPTKRILSIINEDFDVSKGRLFVIGGGKASGLMAQTLEDIIDPQNITAGIVNCKDDNYRTTKIGITAASHPTPDLRGVQCVKQMLALKDKFSINENDLVICLISGGGSALMPCPVAEISLEDKQEMTRLLIEKGPSIQEINTVRKHLSKIKGGRLGKFFSPTRVVSLIISDVIGNDLDTIASGPTVPDSTTFRGAVDVLNKFDLLSKAPKHIVDYLEKGRADQVEETPKKLDNCRNFIIGDIRLALEAMAEKTKEIGLKPFIVNASQKGDPTEMANLRASEILKSKYKGYDVLLIGGETTPKLPDDHGKGGRNQHYAAVSMAALRDYPGEWVMAGIGTDGSDYIDGIAGAIVDKSSLKVADLKGIEIQPYLDGYDSFTLFEKIGNSLVKTGNTGTNVGDAVVYILK
jgi:hydroxypyruvate reductase/glycerate 2-kinase